jgi:hypothetical protein
MAITPNVLTGLTPTIYRALDTVSRELVGFIPSVSRDASEAMAAKDQVIRSFITQSARAVDIAPASASPESGDQTVSYVDMKITKSKMVPVQWTGEEEKAMSGQYSEILADQFAQAMRTLANEVEADLAQLYKKASRAYGTAGTTPFAAAITDSAQMRKLLLDNGAPLSNMRMVVDTAAGANLRALSNLTKANEAGSDATLRRGVLLDLNGFQIRESAGIVSHTKGAYTTGDTVGADASVGDTEITVSSSVGDYVAGDVIHFGTDTAHKYVVKSATASAITIAEPGLKVAVASGTAVNIAADYTPNMAFDSGAIKLLARQPAMPSVGDSAVDVMVVTDPVSGLPFQIALYKQYRGLHYEVGLAWGCELIKPEHVAILLG